MDHPYFHVPNASTHWGVYNKSSKTPTPLKSAPALQGPKTNMPWEAWAAVPRVLRPSNFSGKGWLIGNFGVLLFLQK
jgi:hypothetical protein